MNPFVIRYGNYDAEPGCSINLIYMKHKICDYKFLMFIKINIYYSGMMEYTLINIKVW